MKALDVYRSSGDQSGYASVSSDLGALFAAQGRYDAALKAQQEAVKTFRQLNDRTYVMVCGAGRLWPHPGRGGPRRRRPAEHRRGAEARCRSQERFRDGAGTELPGRQRISIRGDYAAARQQYEKALQLATKSSCATRW